MTALPVVRRELRVAARRSHTHWLRILAGGSVVGIGLLLLLLTTGRASQRELGQNLFAWGAWLSFAWCWVVGVTLTADCFSVERRERTLGLLFLTDLRSADIVLGKLSAISLQALYALLATFPALMITVLMGGVTGAEVVRVSFVLVLTLSLALLTGALASSIFTEVRASLIAGVLLAFVWIALGPLMEFARWFWMGNTVPGPLSVWFLSPLPTLWLAFEEYQRTTEARLWFRSGVLAMVLAIGVSLWLSLVLVRRSWLLSESAGTGQGGCSWWQRLRFRGRGEIGWRRRLFEVNPIEWLIQRDRLGPTFAWVLIVGFGLVAGFSVAHAFLDAGGRFFREMWLQMSLSGLLVLHWLLKMLIATETPRRLFEDKRTGALEMLLVTPVSVPQLLHGQVTGWIHAYLWPVILLVSMNGFLIWAMVVPDLGVGPGGDATVFVVLTVGGIFLLVADMFALFWVGMLEGVRARRQHHAIFKTFLKVLVVPWLLVLLLRLADSAGRGLSDNDLEGLASFWVVGTAIYAFILGSRARRRLERELRVLSDPATCGLHPSMIESGKRLIRYLWP